MNKEIIAPASNNEHRYLSLYEESININSRYFHNCVEH